MNLNNLDRRKNTEPNAFSLDVYALASAIACPDRQCGHEWLLLSEASHAKGLTTQDTRQSCRSLPFDEMPWSVDRSGREEIERIQIASDLNSCRDLLWSAVDRL